MSKVLATWEMIRLISALSMVESGGNAHAYNPQEHAVGHLQIRQCVIDDVNRLRPSGRRFDIRDAYDPRKAEDICEVYLRYWMRIKNLDTVQDAARIWNGGPDGWYQLSTIPYWKKVERELYEQAVNDRWSHPLDKRAIIRAHTIPIQIEVPETRSDFVVTFQFNPK